MISLYNQSFLLAGKIQKNPKNIRKFPYMVEMSVNAKSGLKIPEIFIKIELKWSKNGCSKIRNNCAKNRYSKNKNSKNSTKIRKNLKKFRKIQINSEKFK